LGKNQIQFDATQFIKGQSLSDYSPDGGFGSSTKSVNPRITPGVIYATAATSATSTSPSGNFIASCEDSQYSSAQNRIFVDDVGNYYYFNGTDITKQKTASATDKYTFGRTDIVSYAGNSYVSLCDNTSAFVDNIAQLNTSGSWTLDETWWTATVTTDGAAHPGALNTLTAHPLLVFEGFLWIGDKNLLHYYNSVSDRAVVSVLTLPVNESIQALSIDPATGLMMISVQVNQNFSDTLTSKFFVYLYDGYSLKPRRKIAVDDLVTAFYPLGGTVFIGYGQNLGYWNGSGVTFLRRLVNASLSSTDLLYKHHFAHIGNVLYYVDGSVLMAYGEIIAGSKVFWNAQQNQVSSTHLNCISNVGSNKIGISVGSSTFKTVDMSTAGTATANFYTVNVNFQRPVFVRRLRVFTTGITTTAGIGLVKIIDENGTFNGTTVNNFVVTAAQSPRYYFDFDFTSLKLQTMQPLVTIDTQAFGIVRIVVYYDVAE
jgi:hypothetical protein